MASLVETGKAEAGGAYAVTPRASLAQSASQLIASWVLEPLKLEVKRALHARDLSLVQDNLATLKAAKFVLISTMRNETFRMPYFLEYYRKLGFDHFIIIDNESDDGLMDVLRGAPDVTVYSAQGSYKKSRFGIVWVNHILRQHAIGKWVLHADPDEFLVYPGCDSERVEKLAEKLDRIGMKALPTILLDMYSPRPISENIYKMGQDPLEVCAYFDRNTYTETFETPLSVKHIRGGPRTRMFPGTAAGSPMLNKTPFVRWKGHYAFARSTNEIWPPYLSNNPFRKQKGMAGALLHFKFLSEFVQKVEEEEHRGQHCEEYAGYAQDLSRTAKASFMHESSTRYDGWRQLVHCALISPLLLSAPMEMAKPLEFEDRRTVTERTYNDR